MGRSLGIQYDRAQTIGQRWGGWTLTAGLYVKWTLARICSPSIFSYKTSTDLECSSQYLHIFCIPCHWYIHNYSALNTVHYRLHCIDCPHFVFIMYILTPPFVSSGMSSNDAKAFKTWYVLSNVLSQSSSFL